LCPHNVQEHQLPQAVLPQPRIEPETQGGQLELESSWHDEASVCQKNDFHLFAGMSVSVIGVDHPVGFLAWSEKWIDICHQ
jgi:hypothetical protein